jgi:hypothetical protein
MGLVKTSCSRTWNFSRLANSQQNVYGLDGRMNNEQSVSQDQGLGAQFGQEKKTRRQPEFEGKNLGGLSSRQVAYQPRDICFATTSAPSSSLPPSYGMERFVFSHVRRKVDLANLWTHSRCSPLLGEPMDLLVESLDL